MAEEWITSGDRSHPTLQFIDGIKDQLTYNEHQEDLNKLEKEHFGGGFGIKNLIFKIQESQRIHEGDRSHPRLVELDNIRGTLTYNGWEKDFDDVMKDHKSFESDLMGIIKGGVEKLKRKQSMSIGDRSHPNLVFLDSLELSFPGHEGEMKKALDQHSDGYSLQYFKFALVERELVFQGVRAHPRLVALDSLVLTYPGWEEDVKNVELEHLDDQIFFKHGVHSNFQEQLNLLSRKQTAHDAGETQWLHPIQDKILNAEWSYPGYEDDLGKVKAEDSTSNYTFKAWYEKCNLRQMISDGDFEQHEALITLNELTLSYPGWEQDLEEALTYLKDEGYDNFCSAFGFNNRIDGMKNKQSVFEGSKRAEEDRKQSNIPAADKQVGLCSICFDAPRTHIFVPCGHVCACKPCSVKVMAKNKKCPICNKVSIMTTELFYA